MKVTIQGNIEDLKQYVEYLENNLDLETEKHWKHTEELIAKAGVKREYQICSGEEAVPYLSRAKRIERICDAVISVSDENLHNELLKIEKMANELEYEIRDYLGDVLEARLQNICSLIRIYDYLEEIHKICLPIIDIEDAMFRNYRTLTEEAAANGFLGLMYIKYFCYFTNNDRVIVYFLEAARQMNNYFNTKFDDWCELGCPISVHEYVGEIYAEIGLTEKAIETYREAKSMAEKSLERKEDEYTRKDLVEIVYNIMMLEQSIL